MAQRAGGAIIAALGGPVGIAITGLSMLAIWWANSASAAEESARRQVAAVNDVTLALSKNRREQAMNSLAQLNKELDAAQKKANEAEEKAKATAHSMTGDAERNRRTANEAAEAARAARQSRDEAVQAISQYDILKNKDAMHGVSRGLKDAGHTGQDTRMFSMAWEKQKASTPDIDNVKPRFNTAYKNYMDGEGGLTTTKAEDRAKKLEKENKQFQLAIKDYQVGSKEYEAAVKKHKDRIDYINKEDKNGGGAGRALPAEAKAIADLVAQQRVVKSEIAQLEQSGLKRQNQTEGEKLAEKYKSEAAAARELGKSALAASKDKAAAEAVELGALQRRKVELEKINQLRLQFKADDEKRVLDQQLYNEEAANEVRWLALSNTERAAAQAAWEVEKRYREQILELQKEQREVSSQSAKQEIADRIAVLEQRREEDKLQAAGRARQQAALQEWNQIGSDIERALTDSIMRGFEGGKSGIESFKQALSNAFKSYMVKLLVQPVMSEVNRLGAQMIGGQGSGSGSAAGAGGMNLDSMLGLGKLVSKAGDGLNWLGDALGMDSLKSLGSSLNGLMGSAGTAAAALDGVGSFLGSGMAYGANSALSGFSTGLEGASAGLAGWSAGLQGSAGSFAGLNNTVTSLAQNSAAFNSVANASANSVATGAGGASTAGSSLSTYAGYAASAYSLYNSLKTGQGWGSTIGSMAYFIPGIGPIAGLVGSLVGGLADSAFGHKGGPKTGGNANAVFDASGNVVARDMFGGYTPDQLDKSMRDQIGGLQSSYAKLTQALGGKVRGLTINLGGDQDPKGSAGNRVSAQIAFGSVGVGAANGGDAERALWNASLYSSVSKGVGGDFDAAVKLEVSRMLVAALRASDLPQEVGKMFSGVDLSEATQDQLDMLLAQAQALAALSKAFEVLAPVLPQLTGLSLEAKQALTEMAGGLDQFVSNTANWRANFYTKAEQDNATRKALADELAKIGVALPPTREAYRALVEQMDVTSDKGREAWTVMMKLSSGFASVTASAEDLAKQLQTDFSAAAGLAAKSLAAAQAADKGRLLVDQWLAEANGNAQAWNDQRRAALWGMYASAAPEQQLELLQELQGLMKERYQSEIDAVSGLLSDANRLKDAAKGLRDYVDGLRVGDLSPLTMGERLAESAQQFVNTLSKAQGGDKEALSALQGKAGAYLGLGKDYYASSAPYSGAGGIFEQVTGSLSALGISLDGMASGQLTAAQTAQAQAQYSAAALAEMTRLRDGFGALNVTLMQQTQRQASDAAAILLKMKDDEQLAALKALPAELAAIIKGATPTSAQAGSVVQGWYTQNLGRTADAGGLSYWTGQVQAQGEVKAYQAFSTQADIERTVAAVYTSMLGRAPDQAGWQYWMQQVANGLSYDQMRAQIAASPEYLARLPQFAVGTNELPADMLALVHAGERIMPAADNAQLMARLDEPSRMDDGLARLSEQFGMVVGLLNSLISVLQQHGMLTAQASHDGAQEVVGALTAQVEKAQWLLRSAPTLA